jgi:hypothetical protein
VDYQEEQGKASKKIVSEMKPNRNKWKDIYSEASWIRWHEDGMVFETLREAHEWAYGEVLFVLKK